MVSYASYYRKFQINCLTLTKAYAVIFYVTRSKIKKIQLHNKLTETINLGPEDFMQDAVSDANGLLNQRENVED